MQLSQNASIHYECEFLTHFSLSTDKDGPKMAGSEEKINAEKKKQGGLLNKIKSALFG